MKISQDTPELDAIKLEILNLLIVYYTYRQTIVEYFPKDGTRFDLHRWFTYLRVMENDLILRLCRLDEDDRTKHSLREALKSVRTQISQRDVSVIDLKIKKYRQLINPLKTKRRNYYLAHMAKGATEPFDPQGGLEKPILAVVEISDLIAGTAVSYRLRVGSRELEVDLRPAVTQPLKRQS
jgi:hypothetical protein